MGNTSDTINIGYRIVKIDQDSPLAEMNVEPMLDFIVYSDEQILSTGIYSFDEMINASEDKEIELTIFNIASQETRKIKVTPRQCEMDGLLGIKARAEDYKTAHNRVMRILSFMPGSPLEKAGFILNTDYILGTEREIFTNLDEFEAFVKDHNRKNIEFYVYNSIIERVRTIKIRPNASWGGAGHLGGDIAFGLAHSIPRRGLKKAESNDNSKKDEELVPKSEQAEKVIDTLMKNEEAKEEVSLVQKDEMTEKIEKTNKLIEKKGKIEQVEQTENPPKESPAK